jgi:hypothetical protein
VRRWHKSLVKHQLALTARCVCQWMGEFVCVKLNPITQALASIALLREHPILEAPSAANARAAARSIPWTPAVISEVFPPSLPAISAVQIMPGYGVAHGHSGCVTFRCDRCSNYQCGCPDNMYVKFCNWPKGGIDLESVFGILSNSSQNS